ncbi:hypothetical protein [Castellaniella sp. UC4442_H9]|jgi:hypothetical protein|nr:hypothetical protein [Castellaniella sp.]
MSARMLSRFGAMVCLGVLVAGCSSPQRRSQGPLELSSPCRLNQASCNYNGQYEPGERDYAELEARRLNQAEVQRLRRGF